MMTKAEVRKVIKDKRNKMKEEQVSVGSDIIGLFVSKMQAYETADLVMAYLPIQNEVDTKELMLAAFASHIPVAIPKTIGDDLVFYRYDSSTKLEEGDFHVMEPVDGEEIHPEDYHSVVMLVPGLAFDTECYRMGYGKGYYDRYLAEHKDIVTIGLAYEFQVIEELPREEHDMPLDFVVTPGRVYYR